MLRDNSRTYYECYRAEECYFRKEIVLYGAGEVLIRISLWEMRAMVVFTLLSETDAMKTFRKKNFMEWQMHSKASFNRFNRANNLLCIL